MQNTPCPLCQADVNTSAIYFQDKKRPYHQCHRCALVFVPSRYHLTQQAEKEEYDKHQNELEDEGYLRFLSRLYLTLNNRLAPNSEGLDFGCGPGPALAHKLSQLGYPTAKYDLYYFPDKRVLEKQYDFVTCTEVVEHLAHPMLQIEQMLECLKPGGTLALMTKLVIDQQRFATWHYKNDPTHISFFSRETFEYIASELRLTVEFIAADVIFISKVQ